MWILLLVMMTLYSFQSLFCRLYTSARNGGGAIQFSVFYSAFAGLCTLAINGFAYHPSVTTVVLGLINAMMLLTYNVAMVKCGNLGSYAFMMICVLSGGILVPMIYDVAYLGCSFSALQIAAVALMLISFIVMNLDGIAAKKNVRYLLLCATLFVVNGLYGVFMNLQQTLMHFTQRNEMIITAFLGMAAVTTAFELLFARGSFLEGFRMGRRAAVCVLVSAACATAAVNLLMYLMRLMNLTVLNVVNNGGVLVLSAVFAFTLFREKLELRKVLGMALACASIVILSL